MKKIFCFSILLLILNSNAFSQSTADYQAGSGLTIQPGADVCADNIIINGTFSGGGTICGASASILSLTAFVEGFYSNVSDTMTPDTARVYLRGSVSPYPKVDSAKAVLSLAGTVTFILVNAVNATNYYIVIKHRNSIETWSKTVNAFSSNFLTYNFSSAVTQAYGDNLKQIDTSPSRFGIFSGDENQDGTIDVGDLIDIYNNLNNSGYLRSDINGDDFIDVTDLIITYNNVINVVSVITP